MGMKRPRIAFIDDGISIKNLYNSNNHDVKSYTLRRNFVIKNEATVNPQSHGTLCVSVFSEFAPPCEIIDIQVCSDDNILLNNNINIALNWCSGQNIDLICMSIGTISPFLGRNIENHISALIEQGVIVIAACNNSNRVTYPASLDTVIGVRNDTRKVLPIGKFYYWDDPLDGINISVSTPNFKSAKMFANTYGISLLYANSIAAPYIAAKIATQYSQHFRINVVKNFLHRECEKIDSLEYLSQFIEKDKIIEIPIAGIITDNRHNLESICKSFLSKKILCAILSNTIKTEVLNYHFNISMLSERNIGLKEAILFMLNFFSPDLILVDLDELLLQQAISTNCIDLLILPAYYNLPEECNLRIYRLSEAELKKKDYINIRKILLSV